MNHFQGSNCVSTQFIPTKHAELSKINEKCLGNKLSFRLNRKKYKDLSQGQDSSPDSALIAHHIKNFNAKTLTFC